MPFPVSCGSAGFLSHQLFFFVAENCDLGFAAEELARPVHGVLLALHGMKGLHIPHVLRSLIRLKG